MTQPASRIAARLGRRVRAPFILSGNTGLNDDQNNQALLDTDLRVASNIVNFRAGLCGSRPGSHRDPFGAALNGGAAITGLYDFHAVKDTVQRVVIVCGNKIYVENPAADPSTATDITGAVTVTANALCTATTFKDRLIVTNGADVPFAIPSSGNAVVLAGWFANGRKAQFVHSQFNFLFFGGFDTTGSPGVNQNPMSVYYGELGDDGTWIEANIIDKVGGMGSYGDEYVTALFQHRDFLMIGTNRRIFPVVYNGDPLRRFSIQRPLEVGVAHQNTVVSINGEYTFFMDPRGSIHTIHEVAQSFGQVGVQSLSRKILNYTRDLSRSALRNSHSAYLRDLGWVVWSVPSGAGASDKNACLVFDVNDFPLDTPDWRVAKWFPWTGISANVLAVMQRDTNAVGSASEPAQRGVESLYFGTTTGWVKRFTEEISYDEDDTGGQVAIDTEFATKYFDFGDAGGKKSIVEVVWNMSPASDDPGPQATVDYDYGARSSPTRLIKMDSNAAQGDLLGVNFILGQSRLSAEDGVTTSKDYFKGDGTVASLHLRQSMNGDIKWRMQRAAMLVELRGEIPEALRSQST